VMRQQWLCGGGAAVLVTTGQVAPQARHMPRSSGEQARHMPRSSSGHTPSSPQLTVAPL
jgi:hypothetical protein